MKNLLLAITTFTAITIINSCSKEKSADSYTDKVTCNEADDNQNTYSGKISTLLNTHCAVSSCHNAAAHQDGRDFSTYTTAKSAFDSNALCAINQDNGCEPMPQNSSKLAADILHDLTCWVKNGYPQ